MNYQGSPDQQMSSGLFKGTVSTLIVALLLMASATAFSQSPEIRKAFRYQEIEQPSKMIPALEKAAQGEENLYYLGLGYIYAGDQEERKLELGFAGVFRN